MWKFIVLPVLVLAGQAPPSVAAASTSTAFVEAEDPRAWLEEIESPRSLEWVKEHNARSLAVLKGDARYADVERSIRAIMLAQDRVPVPTVMGPWVYNFFQDAARVRGAWRRATLAEYRRPDPKWEVVLDLDELARREKEDWSWQGADCLPPAYERCMIALSRGGQDAAVEREFDARAKEFVAGGFVLPAANTSLAWRGPDELLVATDFGPGTLTKSGNPGIVKSWRRGTPLSNARTLLARNADDSEVEVGTLFAPGKTVPIIEDDRTFYTRPKFIVKDDDALAPIAMPQDADIEGLFDGRLLIQLRETWAVGGSTLPAGGLVACALQMNGACAPELVWAPDAHSSLRGVTIARDGAYLFVLENVQSVVLRASRGWKRWTTRRLAFPPGITLSAAAAGVPGDHPFDRDADPFGTRLFVIGEGFIQPPTLYGLDRAGAAPKVWKSLAPRFDASGLVADQRWATSSDGGKIPYFLVRRATAPWDGSTPTVLFGYGGFEASPVPGYLAATGAATDKVGLALFLERGGAYALANIRGGGEFGPRWHQAAVKEHRQQSFDDFAAVAEDLIRTKETSARRLGIFGVSNGGLLCGVTLTQRPDLLHAAVCAMPLMDMLRYHKLLDGRLWMDEYGNPDDPRMAEVLRRYSPYQNLRPGVAYPEAFITTSTKDDRVHPGHARKFVAKMDALGRPVYYFESAAGGHGSGASNLDERVERQSLEFVYLIRQLFD